VGQAFAASNGSLADRMDSQPAAVTAAPRVIVRWTISHPKTKAAPQACHAWWLGDVLVKASLGCPLLILRQPWGGAIFRTIFRGAANGGGEEVNVGVS